MSDTNDICCHIDTLNVEVVERVFWRAITPNAQPLRRHRIFCLSCTSTYPFYSSDVFHRHSEITSHPVNLHYPEGEDDTVFFCHNCKISYPANSHPKLQQISSIFRKLYHSPLGIYTEEYIRANADAIMNYTSMCYIIVENLYSEEFIEEMINYLDLKTLIRRNFVSDEFVEDYIFPYCDARELTEWEAHNIITRQRESLRSIAKCPPETRDEIVKSLNKISQSLLDTYVYAEQEKVEEEK
jgi:hypothetical protein